MFLDLTPEGDPWRSRGTWCSGCKRPIGEHEKIENLYFEPGSEHRLEELNGAYHTHCAQPLLSVKRVWDALGRYSL